MPIHVRGCALIVVFTVWPYAAVNVERAGTAVAQTGEAGIENLRQRAFDLNHAALDLEDKHDYSGAAEVLEAARLLWAPDSRLLPEMHANVLVNLADAYEFTGRWPQAAAVLREATGLNERMWGAKDLRTTRLQVRLGEAEVVLGQFASADVRLHSALDQQRNTPQESRTELAQTLASVAVLDVNLGRLSEAEQFASEGAAITEESEPESAASGSVIGVLAGVLVVKRENARALPLLTRSIDILERHSADSVRIAPLLVQRGLIEADDHKYGIAEKDMQRAIAILDGPHGPNINGDWARLHLGRLYLAEGRLDDADAIIPGTVQRQRVFLGGAGKRLALCIREVARLRAMQKRYDEAAALYRETLSMVGAMPPGTQASPRHASSKDIRRLEQRAAVVFDLRGGD